MYAIIETGGKQYKVSKDDVIGVEKLNGQSDAEVVFSRVLMICDGDKVSLGRPYLEAARVTGERLCEFKTKKVIAFKFRRRKSSKTRKGHRQQLVRVKIKEIHS